MMKTHLKIIPIDAKEVMAYLTFFISIFFKEFEKVYV